MCLCKHGELNPLRKNHTPLRTCNWLKDSRSVCSWHSFDIEDGSAVRQLLLMSSLAAHGMQKQWLSVHAQVKRAVQFLEELQ